MIELVNINKVYPNKVQALKNVNLKFNKKELVFIVGESGNGKSTLLNIIGQLDSQTAGDVLIDGINTRNLNKDKIANLRNSYFGFVFQEFYLDKNLNVLENINLSKEKLQMEDTNYNSLSTDLGISDLFDRKVDELSGGQKQRIQIMRALIKNPQVLLCDEPTGSLDESIKEDIYKIFENISKDHLVIIVSHDLEAANTYADRIITIKDGIILSDENKKKTLYKIDNELYNQNQLIKYINMLDSKQINLNIEKEEFERELAPLEKINIKPSKELSFAWINQYRHNLIKNNRANYYIDKIIISLLLIFTMLLVFLLSIDTKKSIDKYLDNNYYDNYVVYNNVSYTSKFYEEYQNSLFSGKKLYNDLNDLGLNIKPVINKTLNINDNYYETLIEYDNNIEADKVEISDYYALKTNLKLGDTIIFNDKELIVSNIFKTEYEKYRNIIESSDINLNYQKSNILDYHINYIKMNYDNLKTSSLYLNYANFKYNKSINKYANSTISISNTSNLNANEIILSKNFVEKNHYDLSIIGKSFSFMNIRDDLYNNYYDNVVSLYDYYKNGFIVKDIVESDYDYLINEDVYNNLIYEYDYYQRPSFYHIESNEKLKDIVNYKIKEENIESYYNKQIALNQIKPYVIGAIAIFVILISLFDFIMLNQFINKNMKSIGIFKSFGYTNLDIKKIYNLYYLLFDFGMIIISSIGFSLIYFWIENKEKNDMLYNKIIPDNYPAIVYVVIMFDFIIFSILKDLFFKKINKKDPIVLIR